MAFSKGQTRDLEIWTPFSTLPPSTSEAPPIPDRTIYREKPRFPVALLGHHMMACFSPASKCAWGCRTLDTEARNPRFNTAERAHMFGRRRFRVRCAVSFRPCIDIHKGKVKQIVGSTLKDTVEEAAALVTNFESDKSPAEFANMYKADELTGGHVIMLGADPLSKAAAIEALHAYPGGLQVGGGINSDNCMSYIDEGASHVIVTSYVFNNGRMDLERLAGLVRVVGKTRLVLDLSCRKKGSKYAIVTDRWQEFSDVFLDARVLDFLANFADEFLVHGVDVEGKKLGIDEELVALLGRHSPIPVTYAGGVTVMEDLERIKTAGLGRVDVTVGSALDIFGGNLAYDDVVTWHFQQQQLKV